jgi:hypothetical protein
MYYGQDIALILLAINNSSVEKSFYKLQRKVKASSIANMGCEL